MDSKKWLIPEDVIEKPTEDKELPIPEEETEVQAIVPPENGMFEEGLDNEEEIVDSEVSKYGIFPKGRQNQSNEDIQET